MKEISWEEYDILVTELANKLLNFFPGEEKISLVGIPRGGELLALLLSYKSGRFDVFPYEDDTFEYPNCVLVDDVLETGKTISNTLLNCKFTTPINAVLIDKSPAYTPDKSLHADISVIQINQKDWFVFPYEKIEIEEEEYKKREKTDEK